MAAVLVGVALVAACSNGEGDERAAERAGERATSTSVRRDAAAASTTTEPRPTTTTTAPPVPAPSAFVDTARRALSDPRLRGTTVGASFSAPGWRPVTVGAAGAPLVPASNQKLATAAAALDVLGPDQRLVTDVRATGALDGGVLHGDLAIVGGGDPTLSAAGPHSLDELAKRVRAAGIEVVAGNLLADESRHDTRRTLPGWAPRHVPSLVGPLSALAVDSNAYRRDAAFVANPTPFNLALFREALAKAGVRVEGESIVTPAPKGSRRIAHLESARVAEIVAHTLRESDNFAAELLLREVGREAEGVGSTEAGARATEAVLSRLGVAPGTIVDGSGVSSGNRRQPDAWRTLLDAVRARPWGTHLHEGLAVAGRTGTLADRFVGTPVEGQLRAKSGFIHGALALSGVVTAASGRPVTFSIVVNGAGDHVSVTRAIDEAVVAIAGAG